MDRRTVAFGKGRLGSEPHAPLKCSAGSEPMLRNLEVLLIAQLFQESGQLRGGGVSLGFER